MIQRQLQESLEDRYKAFSLGYESNPERKGWDLKAHPIDTDMKITIPDDIKPKEYYLINVYHINNDIIEVTESLPSFLDTHLSGRCSLYDLIHTFTIENLEKRIATAELKVKQTEQLREAFIQRQNIN